MVSSKKFYERMKNYDFQTVSALLVFIFGDFIMLDFRLFVFYFFISNSTILLKSWRLLRPIYSAALVILPSKVAKAFVK